MQPSEPKGEMIYLAGPIDGVSADEAGTWRGHARQLLTFRGFMTFNPSAAFHVGRMTREQGPTVGRIIDSINRTAIKYSSAMLAHVLPGQETVGTWREIEFARSLGKPVVIVCPGHMNHVLLYDLCRYETIEEASRALEDLFTSHNYEADLSETINTPFDKMVAQQTSRAEMEELRRFRKSE